MPKILLRGYRCERCGHEWLPRLDPDQEPRVCPKCKSPYWDRPKRDQESGLGNHAGRQAWPQKAPAEADVEARFASLAGEWRRDTLVTSSYTDLVLHPAYQQIIGMGPAVIPLIANELRERPAHWFWALFCIVGRNPVPPEDAGDLEKMTQDWLRFIENEPPRQP